MKRQQVCLRVSHSGKSGQMLPQEVIDRHILARLPVKSLVRFLSVSKSWQSLIFDPNFVKTHFTHQVNQDPDYQHNLIALISNGVMIISRINKTPNISKTNDSPKTPIYQLPFLLHKLIGCINGLVCVYRLGRFWLWNPVIFKFKEYFPPENKNLYRETTKCNKYAHLIGFGWDSLTNDFKLVSCYLSFRLKKCVVYSCNSDSWTEIAMPYYMFPSYLYRRERIVLTPTTIVNNCPFWKYQYEDKFMALVKFEAETNEFRLLPEFNHATFEGKSFDFVNIEDRLAAMVYKTWNINGRWGTIGSVDVYTLDDVSCVWSKMFTVGPINIGLPIRNFSQGFKYCGEIVFNKGEKLFCYDPKTDVVNGFLGSSSFKIKDCFSYTPTLVFLPGMKTVEYFNGHVSWL